MDRTLTLIFANSVTTQDIITKISAFFQITLEWILTKFEGCGLKSKGATPIRSFLHSWREIQILSTYDLDFLYKAGFHRGWQLHCEKKSRRYPDFRLNLRTVGLELRWYIHPNQKLGVWIILVLIYELLALRGWVFAKIKFHQLWDTKSWYLATNISISYTSSSLFW